MQLKFVVITNNAAAKTKNAAGPDNTIAQVTENISKIVLKDPASNENLLQFVTDYETGKTFELGKELTVTIE